VNKHDFQLILPFVLLLFCNQKVISQSVFKVENGLHHIYQYVPNPISYSKFGVKAKDIRLKPFKGAVDTIEGNVFWTPYPDVKEKMWLKSSYLLVQEKRQDSWVTIDTIFSGTRRILPDEFTVEPEPRGFHNYPNFLKLYSLVPSLPFEYEHIHIDTAVKVVKFDAIFFDSKQTPFDSLQEVEVQNIEIVRSKIQAIKEIKWVQFVNVYIESTIWVGDGKYHLGKANDSMIYSVRL
jgi:hypothetical protein